MCNVDEFLTIRQLTDQWPISNNTDEIWRQWVNAWIEDGSLSMSHDFKYISEGNAIARCYRLRSLLRLLYKASKVSGRPNMKKKFVCDNWERLKELFPNKPSS